MSDEVSRRWRRLAHAVRNVSARFTYALGDQVVYSFGNMVVAGIVSRRCGLVALGIYILTQRTVDLLCQLSNAFLWTPFTFNLPGMTKARLNRYQGSTLFLQILFCLTFSAALWGLTCLSVISQCPVLIETFKPLVLTCSALLFREFTRRMYFAHLRMPEAFWTDVATVLLQIAGVLWYVRKGALSVSHTLEALAFGAAAVSVWWVAREWRHWRFERQEVLKDAFKEVLKDARLNLRLGRWFLGSNLVYAASSQCNPWILGTFAGGGWVGIYAVCESVVNIPRVAINSLQNVMAPVVARAQQQEGAAGVRKAVWRLDRILIAASAGMGLVVWICGSWAARLIFGRVPEHARILLFVLALNLVAYAATLAQTYGLAALGRADRSFYASAVGLVVQASACLYMLHRFQVAGAAGSLLFGNFIVYLTRFFLYRRGVSPGGSQGLSTWQKA